MMVNVMVNEDLKAKILEKIDSGSFGVDDFEEYLTLFLEIANESEDVAEEVEGWDRAFLIKLTDGKPFWLKIENGKFSSGKGTIDPDIALEMTTDTCAGVFSGELDATSAYMSGDLKIQGPLPDAVKFRTLTELVREALEE
jgi:putative sterol carrier protein